MSGNNNEKLVAALATPFQSLENALRQLLTERSVDTAAGDQLDVIGKIVGQLRLGMSDEDFRRHIRARISVNRATGVVEDILTVTDLVVYDDAAFYKLEFRGNATIKLTIEDILTTELMMTRLMGMLSDTVAGGVRLIIQFDTVPVVELFQFDAGPGWDQGKLTAAMDNT